MRSAVGSLATLAMVTVFLCSSLLASPGQQQTKPPVAKASVEAPLNLNTADEEALQTLPGVGPAMAQRIVEYREKNGSFEKIEELMNIRGIGEKTFLKLKPLVVVPPKVAGR